MMIFFKKSELLSCFLCLFCLVVFPVRGVMGGPERWMQTTSQKALKKELKKEEWEEGFRLLCFLQLQKKTLPYSCYTWLKSVSLRKNKEFSKSQVFLRGDVPVVIRSERAFLQYLNEKCQKQSSSLKDLKKIMDILQNQDLSPSCRKHIEVQKQIREYQLRDEATENLLKWHYPSKIKPAD